MSSPPVAEASFLKNHVCVFDAVLETFRTACSAGLTVVQPTPAGPAAGIIASISLIGDVAWLISMGLPKDTTVGVVKQFAGFEVPFDSDEMGDAVGELANILAGLTKANLDRMGLRADLSLPSITRGSKIKLLHIHEAPAARRHFSSPFGQLWVEVCDGSGVATRRPGT